MRKPLLLACILINACASGVVEIPDDTEGGRTPVHQVKPDTVGVTDSGDTEDSGNFEDTGSTEDTEDPGDTASSTCLNCTGILSAGPANVVLAADGTDSDTATVTVQGWTTGLLLRCDEELAHVTWAIGNTDTSFSGSTEITFGLTGRFSGVESGVCLLTSDYGASYTINVSTSVCPDCTGITSCAGGDVIFVTYDPYTAGDSEVVECSGTATNLAVTCATHTGASFTRFSATLSTSDTRATGSVALSLRVSDVYSFSEWGACTITADEGAPYTICVWECNNGATCVNPC